VANWWSDGSNAIGFSRGSAGFVAINNEGSALTRTFATGLAAGSYCDVIHGSASGGRCTGPSVIVDGSGNASITVPAGDAVAIDVAAQGTGAAAVAVTFHENATTVFGQNVFLVGSIPALGNWNPANAIPLSSATYPVWAATVSLPANTSFQYKYIKKNPDGSIIWESDPNRSDTTALPVVVVSEPRLSRLSSNICTVRTTTSGILAASAIGRTEWFTTTPTRRAQGLSP
jgi:alpha-amylase